MRLCLFFGIFLFFGAGCATYQSRVNSARSAMVSGDFDQAIEVLKPLAEKQNGDQLVYLLDYGVVLQLAGRYEESNQVFLKADQLSENLDYHSVSRLTGSTLFSEEMVQYKGDSFEKIFINAYLAINYLCLNKLDEALVEARRINQKIIKLNSEEKANFEKNSFGKYLSALIWEADSKWDDAYLDYKEAYEIDPEINHIGYDLLRSSLKARRLDENKKWKAIFPEYAIDPRYSDKNYGELVVFVQQGWGPRKYPDPRSPIMPTLVPITSHATHASLFIEGVGEFESIKIYDVTDAAIRTLQADASALAARRIGSRVAKQIVADQIRQKDELLGAIALIAMVASDRADLRQWSTLPDSIQMIRVPLRAGKYKIKLVGKSDYSVESDQILQKEIVINGSKKKFVNFRTLK